MSYFERQKLPMVVACKSGDADALRRALDAGGDPETLDGSGWTPIMQVCQKGDHVEMVSKSNSTKKIKKNYVYFGV